MQYKVEVEIATKEGVLNPEGKAILHALQTHGFAVSNLTANRKFYFILESASKQDAQKDIESLCQDFLANPIIQDYTYSMEEIQ